MSNMLLLTDHYRYHLYEAPTDMRRSFGGLEGLVKNVLHRELTENDVYVFVNKPLTHIKLLFYSKRKLTLVYEKLHRGSFKLKITGSTDGSIQLSATELLMIIRGIHIGRIEK